MTEDEFRRKLLYRSWHRGTREMDLILGRFAEHYLPLTEGEALQHYANMLQENDPDLYDWITGQASAPDRLGSLILAIQDYCCR